MEGAELKVVALVPARGGSKGIPGKNVRPLTGRPLLHWVLDALAASPTVAETLVATDDDAVRQAVAAFGEPAVRAVDRSPATATDQASTESVLLEVAAASDADAILLVQATSPLLTADDVAQAVARLEQPGVDSVLSVVRQHRFRWQPTADGLVQPANYDPAARPRRQDFDGELVENGALYLSGRQRILDTGVRISGRIAAVEMDPASYLEIDEPSDWPLVEAALQARGAGIITTPPAGPIRAVFTDVDGVLTDAGMYYSADGDALKRFSARDGHGFELLRDAGIATAVITRETTPIVERRAAKLQVDVVRMGARDKLAVGTEVAAELGVPLDQVAYIGDDITDLPLLDVVGLSAAPSDAVDEVRTAVHHLVQARGGAGAFRELAEAVLAHNAGLARR